MKEKTSFQMFLFTMEKGLFPLINQGDACYLQIFPIYIVLVLEKKVGLTIMKSFILV
jgi:hypothetical protein